MRQVVALTLLLLALAGCQASAPPLVPVFLPAPDPYAVAAVEEFPPVVRVRAPRVERWSAARHAEEVAAVSSVVHVRLDRSSELAVLTGPAPAVEVAAAFLSDRARSGRLRARLEVRRARCAPDAWSFEALSPCAGGLWAVVPEDRARELTAEAGGPVDRLDLLDGEAECHRPRVDQQAYIAACAPQVWPGSVVRTTPEIGVMTLGEELRATAHLVPERWLLVLRWSQRRAEAEGQSHLLVRDAGLRTRVAVSLPRVRDRTLEGRFVLRRGEALLLLQPEDGGEVLLTVISWAPLPV